jgi:acetate kinase
MSSTAQYILVVNCGSSTIKFSLYSSCSHEATNPVFDGCLDWSHYNTNVSVRFSEHNKTQELILSESSCDFEATLGLLLAFLHKKIPQNQVVAIAHRVVHGGERFTQSIVVNFETLAYLQTLSDFVPLHQANSLDAIRAFSQAYPQSLTIACFDTGFHADLPVLDTLVPLPATIRDLGVRRFGFHGLSYRSIVASLSHHSEKAALRVVAAHLGSGASVCGIVKGRSLVTSMGFSALDGLMMGTRCGTLDPGILLFLLRQHYSVDQLENMLYRESGLLGVSGIAADMRTLRASALPSAALAINLFTYRLVREIGATIAALGGIDVLVFTGGIGENDAILREKACAALSYLGLRIAPTSNSSVVDGREVRLIHTVDSRVEVWVIPSDENKLAMQDALALLQLNGSIQN